MLVVYDEHFRNGVWPLFYTTMNLLMIIIILFAIMVSVGISYIAWRVSSDQPSKRKINESSEAKESKDLPDS